MAEMLSFTKFENEILPNYRNKLNTAESTEDVKKFFCYSIKELFEKIFEDRLSVGYEDIALDTEDAPGYTLSENITNNDAFTTVWGKSDLSHILERLAESAVNRFRRLQKNPEKTEAKIRG